MPLSAAYHGRSILYRPMSLFRWAMAGLYFLHIRILTLYLVVKLASMRETSTESRPFQLCSPGLVEHVSVA